MSLMSKGTGGLRKIEPSERRKIILVIEPSSEPDKASLFSRLNEEVERAYRYQHFLSLIILNIDLPSLEEVRAKEIAHFLKENCRQVDILYSYGKKKFALLLPETSGEGALSLAWRIKREIEFHSFTGGTKVKVRPGIASYPTEASSGEELLEKAFQALEEKDKSSLRRKNSCVKQSLILTEN